VKSFYEDKLCGLGNKKLQFRQLVRFQEINFRRGIKQMYAKTLGTLAALTMISGFTSGCSQVEEPVVEPTSITETVCVEGCEEYAELTGDGLYELVLSRINANYPGFPKLTTIDSIPKFAKKELENFTLDNTVVELAPGIYAGYAPIDTDYRYAIEEAKLAGDCEVMDEIFGFGSVRERTCQRVF